MGETLNSLQAMKMADKILNRIFEMREMNEIGLIGKEGMVRGMASRSTLHLYQAKGWDGIGIDKGSPKMG